MVKRLYRLVETSTGNEIVTLLLADAEIIGTGYHLEIVENVGDDLEDIKEYYKRIVNKFAGEVRGRFLAVGYGQELTYLEREREAVLLKQAGYIGTETEYPFIFRMASSLGYTVQQVVDSIILRAGMWKQIGSTLEAKREKGVLLIEQSTDASGALVEKNAAIQSLDVHKP